MFKTAGRVILIVAGLAAGATTTARAEVEEIGGLRLDYDDEALRASTPAQRQFLAAYLSAASKQSASDMRALTHSASRACPDTPEQRALEAFSKRSARGAIPDNAKIIFVPVANAAALPFSASPMIRNPVEAQLVMAVSYKRTEPPSGSTPMRLVHQSIIEQLADDRGELRLVVSCLTAEGTAQVRRRLDAQAGAPSAPQ